MNNSEYIIEATRRWPLAAIHSAGRWALTESDAAGRVRGVYLCHEERLAREGAKGCNRPGIVDLESKGCPVPEKCPDRFERDR